MARFIVLIEVDFTLPNSIGSVYGPANPATDTGLYAITTSSDPQTGLAALQSYCPLQLHLIHSIEANSRTDDLERTLQIKYHAQRLRPRDFWFTLTTEDVTFIQAINALNLTRVSGLIKRQLAPPPPPAIPLAELPDFITEQLEKCDTLLNR